MVSSTVHIVPDLGPILFSGMAEAFWLIFSSTWWVWLLIIAIKILPLVVGRLNKKATVHRNFKKGEWARNDTKSSELKESSTNECPQCGGKLVERKGKFGKFYGCSNYPKCRFTKG